MTSHEPIGAGTTVTIATDDGPMPAYVAVPQGTPRGAVVVIQEAFGVTSHIEDVARRFALAGWHAVAPALFHRQGAPVFAYDDFEHVRPTMQTLTAGGITTDVTATFAQLEAAGIPAERIGVVGFCMGGSVALYAATLRRIGAAVSFYGGGVAEGRFGLPSLIELAPQLTAPWLGLYGDLDKGIPVEEVEALRHAAAGSLVETEIVRYADADHGFHCDDRPAVFNPAAAADAWQRTLGWLDRHVAA
jgi:carboxymethylenebutenolidase